MLLKSVKCGRCGEELPRSSAFLKVRFAPYEIDCPKCHSRVRTGYYYRANWTGLQLSKLAFLGLAVWFIGSSIYDGDPIPVAIGMGLMATLLVGAVAACVLCVIVGPVVQLPLELIFGTARLAKAAKDVNRDDEGMDALRESMRRRGLGEVVKEDDDAELRRSA